MRGRWTFLIAVMLLAQRFQRDEEARPTFKTDAEYHFVRVEYTDRPEYHRRWGFASRDGRGEGWWLVDWPDADDHFSAGVERLTRIDTGDPRHFRLTDDRLFDYPWIYATQTGWWGLSDAEVARLREYLLRGGFLMLDDFWGTPEWARFEESMQRVFPDRPIVEIEDANQIFHTVYDLDERYQVPGQWALRRGSTYRNDGEIPHWRGIFDDKGRIMVAMSFNSDVGDSWEWADDPQYPEKYSALGIRLGVNYVIYAMTH
jgi:Domain of unknown function (DUF4159)